jgi:hypothetical protein
MAVAQLNLSRRARLGAALAAPVLSAVERPVEAAVAGGRGRGPRGHPRQLKPRSRALAVRLGPKPARAKTWPT